MAKRFIDTKIWDKAWFRKLTPKNKLIWIYLLTRCDHAGIWDADWEAAEFFIGEWVGYDELPLEITTKMKQQILSIGIRRTSLRSVLRKS